MRSDLVHIIQSCKERSSAAQKELYEMYKGILFGVVSRYISEPMDAEDVFIEGFYKIFDKIDTFKEEGSFEGWMKKIMVNESLMFIRSQKRMGLTVEINNLQIADDEDDNDFDVDFDVLVAAIQDLPTGYKTVFNLYVLEGFKHREIAEMMGISINTSKSQLILAKKKLIEILKKKDKIYLINEHFKP